LQSFANAAPSYQVNSGATVQVDEHGVCRNVENTLSRDLFVPTNSAPEWTSFRNNAPAGVNLTACGPLTEYIEVFDTLGSQTWTRPLSELLAEKWRKCLKLRQI